MSSNDSPNSSETNPFPPPHTPSHLSYHVIRQDQFAIAARAAITILTIRTGVGIHPRLISFLHPSTRQQMANQEGDDAYGHDTIADLWATLSMRRKNFAAILGYPGDWEYQAIVFVWDETTPGWHMLLYDCYCQFPPTGDATELEDYVGRNPDSYMAPLLADVVRIFVGHDQQETLKVLSVWYGDGNVNRVQHPLRPEIDSFQEKMRESGLQWALIWLEKALLPLRHDPLQRAPRIDPRLDGFVMLDLGMLREGL